MKLLGKIYNSEHFLFYLGLILITFDIFPFEYYGLGASKALSTFFFIIYFFYIVYNNSFYVPSGFYFDVILIGLMLLISFLIGFFILNSLDGFSTALSMWGTYIILFVAFFTFIEEANRKRLKLMFECIFLSFKISFVFGIIEVLNFTFFKSDILNKLIRLFVRDDMYLNSGRLQFNFGEPSNAGMLLVVLFIPTLLILNKLNYKFKFSEYFIIVGLFLMEAVFSQSGTFFVLCGVFIVSYAAHLLLRNRKKYLLLVCISIVILILVGTYLHAGQYLDFLSNYDSRVVRIAVKGSDAFREDNSSGVRFGLWIVSFEIWKEHFLLGTGLGNFGYYFNDGFKYLDEFYLNPEMLNKTSQNLQQTYSLISTCFVEGGILGVVWLAYFLSRMRYKGPIAYLIPVFLIAILQTMLLYQPAICLAYLILSNKKINKYLISNNNASKFVIYSLLLRKHINCSHN